MHQAHPPKLRDLIARCSRLGYEFPEIDTGDMAHPTTGGKRVPGVRVQLYGNERGRRNVVAHCQILPMRDAKEAHRLAVRSALAKALELAESPEAILA
jgi:hypothetical protein